MRKSLQVMGVIIVFLIITAIPGKGIDGSGFLPAAKLPDLSGLAWLGDNRFLAVHDAKAVDEPGSPRASLLILPEDLSGVRFTQFPVVWDGKKSNDLESASRIPHTSQLLLAESADSGKGSRRIFRASLHGSRLRVETAAEWPVPVCNVEAMAVAKLDAAYVFLYAERNAHDEHCAPDNFTTTKLGWATFDPDTMRFGKFKFMQFENPDPANTNRPIVALDVDTDGKIFAVAAFDPETAGFQDPDNGPFRSSVWLIGQVIPDNDTATVILDPEPVLEGRLDGFKAESLAVVSDPENGRKLFVGTDDENYGGVLRLLPPSAGRK